MGVGLCTGAANPLVQVWNQSLYDTIVSTIGDQQGCVPTGSVRLFETKSNTIMGCIGSSVTDGVVAGVGQRRSFVAQSANVHTMQSSLAKYACADGKITVGEDPRSTATNLLLANLYSLAQMTFIVGTRVEICTLLKNLAVNSGVKANFSGVCSGQTIPVISPSTIAPTSDCPVPCAAYSNINFGRDPGSPEGPNTGWRAMGFAQNDSLFVDVDFPQIVTEQACFNFIDVLNAACSFSDECELLSECPAPFSDLKNGPLFLSFFELQGLACSNAC